MSRSRRRCLIASLAVSVLCASTAQAQSPAPDRTVAAQGAASVTVIKPKDRTHEGPIHAAVEAAEAKALPRAIADARSKAAELARLSGLTLGPIVAISDGPTSPYGPYIGFFSRFGPDRFCGTVRTTVFKTDKATGKRKRVGTRSHTCQIPPTVVSTVTVTFSA
jgi:uncharacterized protein DUF541